MTSAVAVPDTVVTTARRPMLRRGLAMRLAAAEYARLIDLLRALAPEDWRRPTACTRWDVHAMVGHITGMAEMFASPEERARQLGEAHARGGLLIDALTAVQAEKHAGRGAAELVELLARASEATVRARTRLPAAMRRGVMPGQPVDDTGTLTEDWTVGYLTDVVLTRDTWIHRSDIALATDREMVLTPDHDGVLVADIAREWGQRHGQACTLTLTGPAGGSWRFGAGGPSLELDAVHFARIVSGRAAGDGLLATRVPF